MRDNTSSSKTPGRLEGRVAIVTGGAAGLGEAIVRRLAADGARVVIADRNAELGEAVAESLANGGADAISHGTDVGLVDSIRALFDATLSRHGQVDILVNNAGIAGLHRFLDQPLDDWDRVLRVNLTGTFLCGQMAASIMARRGSGRIINIASVSGIRAGSGRTAYGVSKAGIIMLTRQMALELGRFGVTANAVAPGPVETPMVTQSHTPETRSFFHRSVPLRRYGLPEEIAGAVSYLADDDAAYVNGHVLCVDGGFTSSGIIAVDVGDKLEER
jgi:NAD(P)-dependent dehydrogenase (short-subunit alcohol dehydrogenase family)